MNATGFAASAEEIKVAHVDLAARLCVVGVTALFVLPFVWPVHRPPQPAFDVEWMAGIILALSALAIGLTRRFTIPVQWPLLAWLVALFAVAAGHRLAGMYHYDEQLYFTAVYVLGIGGAYVVGRALVGAGLRSEVTKWIAVGLVGAGVFTVAMQVLQLTGVRGLPWWLYFEIAGDWERTRPFGNVGQANVAATFLAWGIAATMLLLARNSRRNLWVPLPLLILAFGLALTRSRIGSLYALILLAALWLPSGLRAGAVRVRLAWSFALALGYLTGIVATRLLVQFEGGDVADALQRFADNTLGLRLVMWTGAWKVAATSPLFGTGFLEYAAHQYWIATPDPYLQSTPYVHNIVLQLAAEVGWPMSMALVAVGLWWAFARLRERVAEPEQAFAWSALAVIALHSLLEYPLWYMSVAAPAAILFAIAEPTLNKGIVTIPNRLLALAGVCGIVIAPPLALEYDELSRTIFRIDVARTHGKPIPDEELRRLLGLVDASRMTPYAERVYTGMRKLESIEATPEEIAMHERLLWRGGDPIVVARLIVLYAKAGQTEQARRHAERLAVFDPDLFDERRARILSALSGLGPEADPLRRQLESARVVPRVKLDVRPHDPDRRDLQ